MTPAFAGAGLFRKPVSPPLSRGHAFRDHALLLAPLRAVRPLDAVARLDDAEHVPRRPDAERAVAGQEPLPHVTLVALHVEPRAALLDGEALSRPLARDRLRLAAVGAAQIGRRALGYRGAGEGGAQAEGDRRRQKFLLHLNSPVE